MDDEGLEQFRAFWRHSDISPISDDYVSMIGGRDRFYKSFIAQLNNKNADGVS